MKDGQLDSISPAQCRAARSLLNWSQADLAQKASVSAITISNFEKCKTKPHRSLRKSIENALCAAGVTFDFYYLEGEYIGYAEIHVKIKVEAFAAKKDGYLTRHCYYGRAMAEEDKKTKISFSEKFKNRFVRRGFLEMMEEAESSKRLDAYKRIKSRRL